MRCIGVQARTRAPCRGFSSASNPPERATEGVARLGFEGLFDVFERDLELPFVPPESDVLRQLSEHRNRNAVLDLEGEYRLSFLKTLSAREM